MKRLSILLILFLLSFNLFSQEKESISESEEIQALYERIDILSHRVETLEENGQEYKDIIAFYESQTQGISNRFSEGVTFLTIHVSIVLLFFTLLTAFNEWRRYKDFRKFKKDLKALKKESRIAQLFIKIANISDMYGDGKRVLYLKILKIDPENIDAHSELGLLYKINKKNDEAIKHYRKAVDLGENKDCLPLARLLMKKTRYKDAVKYFKMAIKDYPNNVHLFTDLAKAYISIGKPDLAADELKTAFEIDPTQAGNNIAQDQDLKKIRENQLSVESTESTSPKNED